MPTRILNIESLGRLDVHEDSTENELELNDVYDDSTESDSQCTD